MSTSAAWIFLAVYTAITAIPAIKIAQRMGYSGWWGIAAILPPLLIILVWVIALKKWPIENKGTRSFALEGEYIPASSSSTKASWQDNASTGIGCLMALVFMAYGLTIIGVGWIGIEENWGWGWAFFASILAIGFRFTLPITIGAIFGAVHLWDWHWAAATVFAMPGMAFMIPALFASLIGGMVGAFKKS